VSEALGADIDSLGLERGHRTLTVVRKGGKVLTIHSPTNSPCDRPGYRRACGGPYLPRPQRRAPRPPRSLADRAAVGPHAGINKPVGPPDSPDA
jgi:hypothetical protein